MPPQFVPRKKRKAAGINSEDVIPSKLFRDVTKPEQPKNTLPSWRLSKEQNLASKDSEQVETPKKWTEKSEDEMQDRDWAIMCSDLGISSSKPLHPLLNWTTLNSTIQTILTKNQFKVPTTIQRAALPPLLKGSNLLASASTGSGKTLAFVLPIIEKSLSKTLILAPTRELVNQISDVCTFFQSKSVSITTLVGGHDIHTQINDESRPIEIIVATPGRLLDALTQNLISITDLDLLIFDEADRMVDMGFQDELTSILAYNKTRNQTVMFSATIDSAKISTEYLGTEFLTIEVKSTESKPLVDQTFVQCSAQSKQLTLIKQLESLKSKGPVVVFVNTKINADSLVPVLTNRNIKCKALHGQHSQTDREKVLQMLENGQIECIIATDVASRGIDIPNVQLVVNYDFPREIETYIHRIGRTGRAGRKGRSLTLIDSAKTDDSVLKDLRKYLIQTGAKIPSFL